MKKILTGIGNPNLNNQLRKNEEWIVMEDDFESDEELIEYLEREKDIEILFLCSKIIKNYTVDNFIDMIKKLQKSMFIVFFKEQDIETNIEEDEKLKLFNQSEVDNEIFEGILEEKIEEDMQENYAKIISVTGANGVGKSTFSTFFAKSVENSDKKILLIDFDLDENQVRTVLKIKKQPEYNGDINDIVININKNLDVMCYLDVVFNNKEEFNFFKIQEILNKFKQDYDLIIIDTSANLKNEYTKRIFYNSDDIIFLIEPNILGVKKAKNMLEVFEHDWKINNEKIKMVLNKTNIYQISNAIIEELFPEIELIGKMKYNDFYNLMINKNIDKKEIKKEYQKIHKKLCV